jgi:hypothetical protein
MKKNILMIVLAAAALMLSAGVNSPSTKDRVPPPFCPPFCSK